jgi:lipopolysaccharide export system permease protein
MGAIMRTAFPRKAIQYLFFEMWPPLIIGILVFVFIMVMVQAIHFTEFVLIHGVSITVVGQMLAYVCIAFLPALLPMALLFAVLMTYGRLSADSEIVALKATGHSLWVIALPAFLLAVLMAIFSAQTSFHLSPWGNRQFEVLFTKLEDSKASATLKEGTFSEGFFDMVVYANEVNTKTGALKKVFIFDERDRDVPVTVIAKQGKLIQDPSSAGHSAYLRLLNGDIHRQTETHTKVKFDVFDIRLADATQEKFKEKSSESLTIEEISEQLGNSKIKPDLRRDLEIEFNKRWAFSLVCFVFAALGVGLGTTANSRHQKNSGFIISLLVVIVYWVLYVSAEGAARSGAVQPVLAIWIPDFCFMLFAAWKLYQIRD